MKRLSGKCFAPPTWHSNFTTPQHDVTLRRPQLMRLWTHPHAKTLVAKRDHRRTLKRPLDFNLLWRLLHFSLILNHAVVRLLAAEHHAAAYLASNFPLFYASRPRVMTMSQSRRSLTETQQRNTSYRRAVQMFLYYAVAKSTFWDTCIGWTTVPRLGESQ